MSKDSDGHLLQLTADTEPDRLFYLFTDGE